MEERFILWIRWWLFFHCYRLDMVQQEENLQNRKRNFLFSSTSTSLESLRVMWRDESVGAHSGDSTGDRKGRLLCVHGWLFPNKDPIQWAWPAHTCTFFAPRRILVSGAWPTRPVLWPRPVSSTPRTSTHGPLQTMRYVKGSNRADDQGRPPLIAHLERHNGSFLPPSLTGVLRRHLAILESLEISHRSTLSCVTACAC